MDAMSSKESCCDNDDNGNSRVVKYAVKRLSWESMGKDKDVVDPDPDKIYSCRKERSSTKTKITSKDGVSVNFPSTVGVLRWKRCPCLQDSK